MVTWKNVGFITYVPEVLTTDPENNYRVKYKYQLFYHQSKKVLKDALFEKQCLVETKLGVKLIIRYEQKQRILFLEVLTNLSFDKEALIDNVLDCYEDLFYKPEKFLSYIKVVDFGCNAAGNYLKFIIEPGYLSTVFGVLEGRGNRLSLEAEKYHVEKGDSFITLTPRYGKKLTMEDLLALKNILLLPKDEFLEECKAKKLDTSLTKKSPKKNLRKQVQAISKFINLPLSNSTNALKSFRGNFNTAASPNTLWFKKQGISLPKKQDSSEIIVVDNESDDPMMKEFKSHLLADIDLISSEDFGAVQAAQAEQNLNKRKANENISQAETSQIETSKAYKVQKTSGEFQADQHNAWEVEEFMIRFNLQP